MPRKRTLRLKTRARLLAEDNDMAEPVSQAASSLKTDLRLLYERSSLTVREIASAAGLSARMIYKYAEQGRWIDRETRVSRQLALLDPAAAQTIAARAKEALRVSDQAAARVLTRMKVRRTQRNDNIAFARRMRAYEMLASTLADLGRHLDELQHDEAAQLAIDLEVLILRQMRMAFDAAA